MEILRFPVVKTPLSALPVKSKGMQYWGKYHNKSISKFYIVVWFNSLIHHHCHCCVSWNQGYTLTSIGQTDLTYQSNRSFNIPPPRAYPGHLTPFPAQEGGVLITTHGWWGIWSLATISCYELRWFPRRLINKSWQRRWRQTFDEFKGKYCVFMAEWLKTKGLHKLCCTFEGVLRTIYTCIYLWIYKFTIISELNKEFPAIWLVEWFFIWRYINLSRRFI